MTPPSMTRRSLLRQAPGAALAVARLAAPVTLRCALPLAAAWPASAAAQAADPLHAPWTTLLQKHVRLLDAGKASQLRYAGMAADLPALKAYLASLTAVPPAQFDAWDKPRQMALLINAYNAHTVALILTRYPRLETIKDLGSLLQGPWKPKIVPLLGRMLSLDDIEHEMLRAPGRYGEPRVHFAVNCASIGCPALREEAFVAERLDAQLQEQTVRFLADRSRNRWNPQRERLEVSKIFDWFGDDFRQGHRGIGSLEAFFARHADQLADTPADRERIRSQKVKISFLDYDWALNDAPR